jgi:Domain of unknown function (DUF5658)
MKNKWYLLAISLGVLNLVDCASTLYALRLPGVIEANPIMAFVLRFGIVPFILVKLLAVLTGFPIAQSASVNKGGKYGLIFLNIIYCLVVANNLFRL